MSDTPKLATKEFLLSVGFVEHDELNLKKEVGNGTFYRTLWAFFDDPDCPEAEEGCQLSYSAHRMGSQPLFCPVTEEQVLKLLDVFATDKGALERLIARCKENQQ